VTCRRSRFHSGTFRWLEFRSPAYDVPHVIGLAVKATFTFLVDVSYLVGAP